MFQEIINQISLAFNQVGNSMLLFFQNIVKVFYNNNELTFFGVFFIITFGASLIFWGINFVISLVPGAGGEISEDDE